MKRSIIIACALAIGSSLGMAEDQASTQYPASVSAGSSQNQPQDMRLFDSSLAENKKIMDQDGKDLGKLEKLLIDAESGRVRFAVVQVDKAWSLNDPEVIIPWSTLQISRIGEKDLALKIDTTRDKLMNAPHFDKKLVHQLNTPQAAQPIYSYWGATWRDDSAAGTANRGTPQTQGTASGKSPANSSTSSTSTPSTGTPSATSSSPTPPTPATTTDGSAGTQPIGNSGTTDSPKPDSSLSKPKTSELNTESKSHDSEVDSGAPDRTLGEDESD